jgi:hypothetical protein
MTSVAARLGSAPALEEVAAVVARHFARVFDRELAVLDRDSALARLAEDA